MNIDPTVQLVLLRAIYHLRYILPFYAMTLLAHRYISFIGGDHIDTAVAIGICEWTEFV